ncbi:hypothetical protein [Vreelandella olivaria]|uniref:hypothetical protein n=1 Tax=Vreelandella olivaria TaxID=390919 RepID=UPI00201F611D|nr:hypothetical protein [Halomonas olivaria]
MTKLALLIVGMTALVIALPLLVIAAVVSLFKIYEADRYYGVGCMTERPFYHLTGLPFSLWRMIEYALLLLKLRTRYGQRRYARELELIIANSPPKRLESLLIWLYAPLFILTGIYLLTGGTLVLFF